MAVMRSFSPFLVPLLFLSNWLFTQYSIQRTGLSSWRGGGFGMFAGFGQVPERAVIVSSAHKLMPIPPNCSAMATLVAELPSVARINNLAKCVNQPPLKLEVWDQAYFGGRNVGYRRVAEKVL